MQEFSSAGVLLAGVVDLSAKPLDERSPLLTRRFVHYGSNINIYLFIIISLNAVSSTIISSQVLNHH